MREREKERGGERERERGGKQGTWYIVYLCHYLELQYRYSKLLSHLSDSLFSQFCLSCERCPHLCSFLALTLSGLDSARTFSYLPRRFCPEPEHCPHLCSLITSILSGLWTLSAPLLASYVDSVWTLNTVRTSARLLRRLCLDSEHCPHLCSLITSILSGL